MILIQRKIHFKNKAFTFFNFSLLIWMFVGQITIISFSMLHPILALLDTNRSALNDSLLDSIFSHYSVGFIARELRRVSCAISAFFKIWKLSWLGNYWILLASFFLRQNAILFVFPYFRHTKKKKKWEQGIPLVASYSSFCNYLPSLKVQSHSEWAWRVFC